MTCRLINIRHRIPEYHECPANPLARGSQVLDKESSGETEKERVLRELRERKEAAKKARQNRSHGTGVNKGLEMMKIKRNAKVMGR